MTNPRQINDLLQTIQETRTNIESKRASRQTKHKVHTTDIDLKPIIGLDDKITEVLNKFIYPLHNNNYLQYHGLQPERGLLITGYKGTGKTNFALSIPKLAGDAPFIVVEDRSINSIDVIDSLNSIMYKDAVTKFIIVDPVAITNVKDVIRLFKAIDRMKLNIGVIGITRDLNIVEEYGLLSPGLFGVSITIPLPDKTTREMIIFDKLQSINLDLGRNVPEPSVLANMTSGYTLAEIISLINNIAIQTSISSATGINPDNIQGKDSPIFKLAYDTVKPELLRHGFIRSDVTWDDIGGMNDIRDQIINTIIKPREYREVYKSMGFSRPPNGNILLHGPPGVGKTYIIKALSNEIGFNLMYVTSSDIIHSHLGKSAKSIKQLFDKARMIGNVIIFIDEADSILTKRTGDSGDSVKGERVSITNEFLQQMDGFETTDDVIIIAATNLLEMIDPAFLRYGRFTVVEVGLPNYETRREVIINRLSNIPNRIDSDDVNVITDLTEGYSNADIIGLIERALLNVINERYRGSELPVLLASDVFNAHVDRASR